MTASSHQSSMPLSNPSGPVRAADKIKHQQHFARFTLGNDKEAHRTPTDYRNNYLWTIPKYAM